MAKIKLYLGHALKGAPEEFLEWMQNLKRALQKEYVVLEFMGINDDDPEAVNEFDLNCVRSCDLMLAVCDYPSTGLGMEINEASHCQKPTFAVSLGPVSNMVRGNRTQNTRFEFKIVQNYHHILPKLEQFVQDQGLA